MPQTLVYICTGLTPLNCVDLIIHLEQEQVEVLRQRERQSDNRYGNLALSAIIAAHSVRNVRYWVDRTSFEQDLCVQQLSGAASRKRTGG